MMKSISLVLCWIQKLLINYIYLCFTIQAMAEKIERMELESESKDKVHFFKIIYLCSCFQVVILEWK